MSRKPKPPIGFVPVDSEEADTIPLTQYVNQVFISRGKWVYSYGLMHSAHEAHKNMHYHVQLPPAVEWEGVWGWYKREDGLRVVTKNGQDSAFFTEWTEDMLNTIVRALNEMEAS